LNIGSEEALVNRAAEFACLGCICNYN